MGETAYKALDIEAEIANLGDFVPYGQRLVVKELEVEKVGLLHIPETSVTKEMQTNLGHVLAVGEDVGFCEVRDKVYYGRYSGAWFTWKGSKYRIMNEEDLLGRVK